MKTVKIAGTVIVIAFILTIVFFQYYSGYLDSDEKGFAAFADRELSRHHLYENSAESFTSYEHDDSFSLAVRKTGIRQETIAQYRDRKIQEIVNSCDKENIRALIIDSASFKSDNGTISFYIQYREYVVKDRRLKFYHSEVETFLFNGKTGRTIEAMQSLKKGYRKPAAEYAPEYFKTTYRKKQLKEAYKDNIKDSRDNFNKFIIDGSKFVFMFDEGTVVDESLGTVSMLVPAMIMGNVQRNRILNRYVDVCKPMVALTYDDGPGGEPEMKILDVLYENGAVATFFYVGNRMSYSPETAVRASQIGCEIGNHSWNHIQYSSLSNEELRDQIERTNSEICDYCGIKPLIARPPYGDYKESTVSASPLPQILWTVDTRDWATRNPKDTFDAVKRVNNLDGQIILMHSLYEETAQATEMIVPWLKENGYQTVTVSELIKYKTGEEPKQGRLYRELN